MSLKTGSNCGFSLAPPIMLLLFAIAISSPGLFLKAIRADTLPLYMCRHRRHLRESTGNILNMYGTPLNLGDEITVRVSPRIHLGLISMHANAVRSNGGVGFAITEPSALISVSAANQFLICDDREQPLSGPEINQLQLVIEEAAAEAGAEAGAKIRVTGKLRTHVGMGSGTALRLGILEAVLALNGIAASREHLIRESRRGGTSGIG